jgi:hypothetical protein
MGRYREWRVKVAERRERKNSVGKRQRNNHRCRGKKERMINTVSGTAEQVVTVCGYDES